MEITLKIELKFTENILIKVGDEFLYIDEIANKFKKYPFFASSGMKYTFKIDINNLNEFLNEFNYYYEEIFIENIEFTETKESSLHVKTKYNLKTTKSIILKE